MLAAVILAGLVGLVLGSFLGVVADRLPRRKSVVSPGSHCTGCGQAVRPYDNIPVLSWLLLRGRCRHCAAPIPRRYPLTEALTGALFAAVVIVKGADERALGGLVLVILLVPVALIDLEHRIIPNRLLAPAAVLAVVIQAAVDLRALPEHLIAGAAALIFFGLAALAYPRGMGMGDVKLAGTLGLFLGGSVAVAVFVALVAGTLVGLAIIARRGVAAGRKTAVPFGPFLALGGIVGLLAGPPVVQAYLDAFT